MSDSRKNRRSSILKLPKPRNPLSDIDLNPPTENTFMRQSRRVSFANNNFIKEFTSDPEKNTIWDTTYEEAISKSDHSSENSCKSTENAEENLGEVDDFNCTRIDDFDVSIEIALGNNSMETSYSSANIDLMPNVGEPILYEGVEHIDITKQNITTCINLTSDVNCDSLRTKINSTRIQNVQYNAVPPVSSHINVVDKENNPNLYHKPVLTTGVGNEIDSAYFQFQNIPQHTTLQPDNTVNAQSKQINYISNTQNNLINNVNLHSSCNQQVVYLNKSAEKRSISSSANNNIQILHLHSKNSDMQNTNSINQQPKNETIYFGKSSNNSDNLDITMFTSNSNTRIDSNRKTIHAEMDMTLNKKDQVKRQTVHFNSASKNSEMDITQSCSIANVNRQRSDNFKRQTIYFNKGSEDANLDLTVSANGTSKTNNFSKNRQTLHFNNACKGAEIDITQAYSATANDTKKRNENARRETILFDNDDAEMEMTDTLPPGMNLLTRTYSSNAQIQICDAIQEKENSSKRKTIHFKQDSEEAYMDISGANVLTGTSCKDFGIQDSEITKSIPRGSKILLNMHKRYLKEQTNIIRHFTENTEEENMGLTQSSAVGSKVIAKFANNKNRHTIHFNNASEEADMEVTQADLISTNITNANNIKQYYTTHFNEGSEGAEMDLTEELPLRILNLHRKSCSSSNRQTIYFDNASSEECNMEITQAYPTTQNFTENNIDNSKRKTILFKQGSKDAEMDLIKEILPEVMNKEANSKRQTIHFCDASKDANMEMTQAYPTTQNFTENNTDNIKRNTIHFKHGSNDAEMNVTKEILPETMNKEANSKRQTIHFCDASKDADMEMTQAYLITQNNTEKNTDNIKRNTIHFKHGSKDAEMNVTKEILPETMNKEANSKRQTIHFCDASKDADMEMTQAYLITQNFTEKNTDNIKRNTIHFKHGSKDAEMNVIKEILPETMNKEANSKRQTIHFCDASKDADMEMTQAYLITQNFTEKNTDNIKRNTIHFKHGSKDAEMNVTKEILPETMNKEANSKRQTIHFCDASKDADMEMTQAYPITQNFTEKNTDNIKRKTIHFKQDSKYAEMDVTQGLLPETMNKNANSKRQTLHFCNTSEDGDMEMTQAYPNTQNFNNASEECNMEMTQLGKNNDNTKRKTIYFNEDSKNGRMDLTEVLLPESKRKTIHFNNCEDANMDMTQTYSTTSRAAQENNIKRNTIHFNGSKDGEMNLTEQLLPRIAKMKETPNSNQQTIDSSNVLDYENIEIIQIHPITQNVEKNDVVMTKPIPNKSEQVSANRSTIHFNNASTDAEFEKTHYNHAVNNVHPDFNTVYNPEMTNLNPPSDNNRVEQQVVDMTSDVAYKIANSKRSTIHLNKDSENAEIDVNLIVNTNQHKKDELEAIQKQEISSKRRTINFNKTGEAAMDIPDLDLHAHQKQGLNNYLSHICNNTNQELSNEISSGYEYSHNKISEGMRSNTSYISRNVDISGIASIENTLVEEGTTNQNFNRNINDQPNLNNEILNEENTLHDQLFIPPHTKQEEFVEKNNSAFVEDDICQVIRMPGQSNPCITFNLPINIDLSKSIYLSPVNERDRLTLNLSRNCSSYVDDTERLINYKIGDKPVSEYSKIVSEEINLSALDSNILCRNDDKNDTSFYIDYPSLKSRNASVLHEEEKTTGTYETSKCENNADSNKNEESCILINSSSDNDCCNEILEIPGSDLSLVRKYISMPPDFAELYRAYKLRHDDSLKSFVEKSIHNGTTSLSESISLVESFNSDASNEFLAVSVAAREVEKMINKSVLHVVIDDSNEENSTDVTKEKKRTTLRTIKHKLDKCFPISKCEKPVISEEAIRKSIFKGNETFKRISKWVKNAEHNETKFVESKQMTLEEKIKQLSEDTMWDMISMNNDKFKFTFMFASIEFTLHMDRITENVKCVRFFTRFVESVSDPSAVYVHSILKKKLSQNFIKSACGQIYTIFTFLDYITLTGQQMIDIMAEFERLGMQYGVVLDSNLNASFKFINLVLRVVFEISLNILKLDTISEEDISLRSIVGIVREADVKRLAKGCPQGIPFIRAFILSVNEYLKLLETAKQNRLAKKIKKPC